MNIFNSENIEDILKKIVEEKIPFNRVIGIEFNELKKENISIKFKMKDELVGNFYFGVLHGGVIASALDLVGGITAFYSLLNKYEDINFEEKLERLTKLSTIDLRVDFLRPGKGEYFIANGNILRLGKKVAVARMELINESKDLIALGTGTYNVG